MMLCVRSIFICFSLSAAYVGSLYIWKSALSRSRDHPSTIKKRFISVLMMTLVSSVVVYSFADVSYFKDCSFLSVVGMRWKGIVQAVIYPLLLTMVLFLGPLTLYFVEGTYCIPFDITSWRNCVCDVTWLRNHVVAPFSEEFTFRACMLPILLPCFGSYSVIICPLFFGIAHLHHLREILAQRVKLKVAVMQSLFQFSYTTIFGAYSSYLFVRTGHFVAPFIAHAFCNHMGFPDFGLLLTYNQPKKTIMTAIFACGLSCWIFLLKPLTDPSIYSNDVYS